MKQVKVVPLNQYVQANGGHTVVNVYIHQLNGLHNCKDLYYVAMYNESPKLNNVALATLLTTMYPITISMYVICTIIAKLIFCNYVTYRSN